MRSAFKVARVSKNFMCGRFSQLSCTSLLNNQWEQARVIDILYRSDWNIIGYKIASEAWPRSPLFMFSYSLVRSVSVRKLFSLCHSLLDDLSLVALPLGTTLTHAIAKNLSDSSDLINMRNEIFRVWKWFDLAAAESFAEGYDNFMTILVACERYASTHVCDKRSRDAKLCRRQGFAEAKCLWQWRSHEDLKFPRRFLR